jgi:hypothetical protein
MPYTADKFRESKRTWASIMAIVSIVLANFGVDIAPDVSERIVMGGALISGGLSVILPLWSKWREKAKLKEPE